MVVVVFMLPLNFERSFVRPPSSGMLSIVSSNFPSPAIVCVIGAVDICRRNVSVIFQVPA
jgi:hypothetical protein